MTARRWATSPPTPDTVRGDDWRASAACVGRSDLFHPPGSQWGHSREQARHAKALCATCPVVASCLAFAFEVWDDHAILGGTTPDERRAIRRKGQTA